VPARCQSEISNLYVFHTIWAGAYKNVLGLEVAVDDVEAVDVGEALENLAEEAPDFLRLLV
jgi:hypothetical protein